MSTQYIRWPSASSNTGVPTYANVAAFPASPSDGQLAIALDTHLLYEYNSGLLTWQVIGGANLVLSIGTVDSQTPSANGAVITSNALVMQSASATVPGLMSTAAQTFAGIKTFNASIVADGGVDAAGTLTLGSAATTINIGNAGSVVNIQGTTIYENTPILQVVDPKITLNTGGGAGSGQNSGFEIEEAGSITGYVQTSAARTAYELKAPASAGVVSIVPGIAPYTIDQGSHNPVTIGTANGLSLSTQVLSMDLASATLNGAVSTAAQTFAGAKTFTGDTTLNANLILAGTVNSSLTGANARISSHIASNVTFTNVGLTSIASANNGGVASGHLLCLTNETGASITIVNNYGGAAAGEAIYTGAAADIVIPNHSSFFLQYNGTASAWLCIVSGINFIGTLDAQAKSANGATQLGNILYLQTADATNAGLVGTAAQTFAGAKTFSSAPILSSLTASLPLKLDASKNVTSAAIDLSGSEVTSTLPIGNGGTGQTTKAAAFDALSPMTTVGDIIYGGTSGTGTRLAAGSAGQFLKANGAAAPSWQSFTAPTMQVFTTGSGTYTTPANVTRIKIRMIGGGGGGSGSGTALGGTGSGGGNTTFGSSLLTANGGSPGAFQNATNGSGGTTTINSPAYGFGIAGGNGGGRSINGTASTQLPGAPGGNGPFGGGAFGSLQTALNGQTNTGGGGSGGGTSGTSNSDVGSGGGAGGHIEAYITSPSATYAYAVGAGGGGGTAGTNGFAGGSGGSGIIIVEEFYQ